MRARYSCLFLGLGLWVPEIGLAQAKIWTSTTDFNEGTYFNTNSTVEQGSLRLNRRGTAPVPFLNVPVGGRELANRGWRYEPGRVVRIDTVTGEVVGDYRTTPIQFESAPSRAVVDGEGNLWVTNRYEGSGITAVTKIGVLIGGVRYRKLGPGAYVPDPFGQYVKDPTYTTGVDRDGDGYIRTSRGLGDYLNWNATAGKDLDSSIPDAADGLVEEAEDELVLIFKRHRGTGNRNRSVAIDGDDNIWVGFQDSQTGALRIDPHTGGVNRTILSPLIAYGLLFHSGWLIGSGANSSSNVKITRVDPVTGAHVFATGTRPDLWDFFAPLGPGKIVASCDQFHTPAELAIVDLDTMAIEKYIAAPGSTDMRGVTVDQEGNIWAAARGLWTGGNQRVYKFTPEGTLLKELYTGARPCGLGLDSDGNVWVTHIGEPSNFDGAWATKIDPNGGADGEGEILGTVFLGIGSYNYSDGTGATTSQVAKDGEWRGVYDSFLPNAQWGALNWDALIPAQTSVEFFIRAANTRLGLNNVNFVKYAANGGQPPAQVSGRFAEIRVRLARAEGTDETLSPVVRSFTLRYAPGTILGTVGLGNWIPSEYPVADFVVRPPAGADVPYPGIELGPLGAYALTVPQRGSHAILAKSSHWLRQRFPTSVNITNDGAVGVVFALINGDIDADNAVTIFDYIALSGAFDTVLGDSGFVAEADLDGDGAVTIFDYVILSENFDSSGDE